MHLAYEDFLAVLNTKIRVLRPAYQVVKAAYEERTQFHESGKLVYMKKTVPWKQHLMQCEEEDKNEGGIKFVLFQDDTGMYRVQTVP